MQASVHFPTAPFVSIDQLRELTARQFSLVCGAGLRGYGRVMMGILRAMADDYGALVFLEHNGQHNVHHNGQQGGQTGGPPHKAHEADSDHARDLPGPQAHGQAGAEVISITLVEADFAAGRDFDLGARAG